MTVRDHQVLFEEPLRPAGVFFPPPNQFRPLSRDGGDPRTISLERSGASQLETVCQERKSRVEVQSCPEAWHIAPDELVVKKALQPAGNLLA